MGTRRTLLGRALGACSALFAVRTLSAQTMQMQMPVPPAAPTPHPQTIPPASQAMKQQTSVVTTDVGDLAYTMDGSTKVYHLVAEVLRQKIHPDKAIDVWGFNGTAPGPTIQVNQGDHVRVIFDNHLPEPSSIHWHGFEDMIGNDGMPGISQDPVRPGGRFIYEFDIHQSGTYFYHSDMAEDFLALADKNNPTLQQAAAIIRRSEAQAKQAALYPNPSIGYEGDQIRGGSYGGGNRAALLPKPSFGVASSACAATFMSSRSSLIKSQPRPNSLVCTTM